MDRLHTFLWISQINGSYPAFINYLFFGYLPIAIFRRYSVTVSCSKDWHNIHIYKDRDILRTFLLRRPVTNESPGFLLENQQRKRRSGKQSFRLLKLHKFALNRRIAHSDVIFIIVFDFSIGFEGKLKLCRQWKMQHNRATDNVDTCGKRELYSVQFFSKSHRINL